MAKQFIPVTDTADKTAELYLAVDAIAVIHKPTGMAGTIIAMKDGTKVYADQSPQDVLKAIDKSNA